jgi:dTDP-4-dehydrorhamnose reductase
MICVTGSTGRLGRAVIASLAHHGATTLAVARDEYDLDDETAAVRLVERYRPDLVVHCAAWTAVDDCARHPDLAMRRNGQAVAELASACANGGARLAFISTNEVFDGLRTDGRAYDEADDPHPINAYGESKLAGERAAAAAFGATDRSRDLMVVRTSWLFGPPGNDFPTRILVAADRLPNGEPLKVVSDEVGSPSYAPDVADALVLLLSSRASTGVYHLVNEGSASRQVVADRVLASCRPERRTVAISSTDFDRPSKPPAWSALANRRAAQSGVRLRPWLDALNAYLPQLSSC